MQDDKLIVPRDLAEVREHGFPYFHFDDSYQTAFKRLCERDHKLVLADGNKIKISGAYTKLASVFFPQMFHTRVNGMTTPIEAWNSDKLLARAIELTHRYFVPPSYKALRNQISFVSGTQRVSNFRPDVAKYIYNEYGNRGKVYDYSMGYGGRLVGFFASDCTEYCGVDVNEENFIGYGEILKTFGQEGKNVFAWRIPAERFKEEKYKEYFDLAFSSPPYFCKEEYSDDEEQSYKKYGTIESWVTGFLRPTIENIKFMLKPEGYFVINIGNIRIKGKSIPLVDYAREIASELGFVLVKEYTYNLTKILGVKDKFEAGNFKNEPIMVFKKGS